MTEIRFGTFARVSIQLRLTPWPKTHLTLTYHKANGIHNNRILFPYRFKPVVAISRTIKSVKATLCWLSLTSSFRRSRVNLLLHDSLSSSKLPILVHHSPNQLLIHARYIFQHWGLRCIGNLKTGQQIRIEMRIVYNLHRWSSHGIPHNNNIVMFLVSGNNPPFILLIEQQVMVLQCYCKISWVLCS